MTSPISSVSATAGTVPTTATVAASQSDSANSMALDPKAFLQLLVAQLKYQDPSSPMDTASFMNQTATLSQVQTMNSMSTTLSSLAGAQQEQAATDLIGKQITYLDANGMSKSGVVDSASLTSGAATLHVGTDAVALSGVLGVAAAKTS
ncbi:flagellar hook assembly protein FlgD [uncultured Jatrophihabitans sp.]|uniref:flagellar hook assembly protein FlgD n=1 Tax=uncultured Jatrophihabitans sp. TaxID=1610747 RepID=UPI0035CBC9C4